MTYHPKMPPPLKAMTNARRVEYHDLQFDEVLTTRYSTCGVPFPTLIGVGVPRLNPTLFDSVFYLYQTVEDARNNKNTGGTGFFVAVPSPKYPEKWSYVFAVTNWHVAIRDGFSVNVFMVGRFVDHDGITTNKPAVRFGHLIICRPTGKLASSRGRVSNGR